MYVRLVLILAPRVFLWVLWFFPSTKTNLSKFQFDLGSEATGLSVVILSSVSSLLNKVDLFVEESIKELCMLDYCNLLKADLEQLASQKVALIGYLQYQLDFQRSGVMEQRNRLLRKRQEEQRQRELQEKAQKEREYRFPQPKIKVSLGWTCLLPNYYLLMLCSHLVPGWCCVQTLGT